MKNVREEIIAEFKKLDAFSRYVNLNSREFVRDAYRKQVEEELQYYCKEHQYSNFLKDQFIDLYGNGFVEICGFKHPYEPMDIYCCIEAVINNLAIPKPFSRKTSFLYKKNIFHTHHSQSFYIMFNCIRYFEKKYTADDDVWKRLKELRSEYPKIENLFPVFANEVLLESVSWQKKTGEWLVYAKHGEKIKFLCMYIHDSTDQNDGKLLSLIKEEIELST